MNQRKATISLFCTLSILNLIANGVQRQDIIYLTKPLLMATLAAWFYFNVKNNLTTFAKYILVGLIFAMAGDTLLMFAADNPPFFIYGLGSFLMTHVFYILAFNRYPAFAKGIIIRKKWLILPVFLYLIIFLGCLWDDLPQGLKIPVLAYGSVISMMLLSAINMKWRIAKVISSQLIIGASLFVISDSIIAVNKFMETGLSPELINISIMATYLFGQYLIVNSWIQLNNQKVPDRQVN